MTSCARGAKKNSKKNLLNNLRDDELCAVGQQQNNFSQVQQQNNFSQVRAVVHLLHKVKYIFFFL
jgi:hypothetical protein